MSKPESYSLITLMNIKYLFAVALLLLLSACGTKLAYNYLDWIIEWYAEDLVTLNDDQEWALIDAIQQELDWHRTHQLPMYIKSLDDLSNSIENGLTKKSVEFFYTTHERGWMELKYHITPTMTRLLRSLSDSQIEQLSENLKDQEQELSDEYANKPVKELIKQRAERMVDRIEDWTGSLNNSQIQTINNWSHNIKQTSSQWIETRRNWQANLLQILREYRDKPVFSTLINELFQNSRKHWPKWYHEAYYYNVDLTLEMMVELENQLTDRQRRTLLNKITALRQQFAELHDD